MDVDTRTQSISNNAGDLSEITFLLAAVGRDKCRRFVMVEEGTSSPT
jgi:hypothetical protein